jgi:uncharacterized Zn-binding protein involved in type VI secretion
MPGKPAARVGDPTAHGGSIAPPGAPMVLIGGQPAARMNDRHICPLVNPGTPPPPHVGGQIIATCVSVLIAGQPAARLGDTIICQGPPDSIMSGCMTVLIGDGGGGGGGGAGGAKVEEASAEAKEVEQHYLDAKFVDKSGKPITGVQYTVRAPDGEEAKAPLSGKIKKSGIKEGNYDISLKGITKAEWSKKDAKVDDTVKIKVEAAGIDSGEKALIKIFIRDANFADHVLKTINSEVKDGKIEEEWKLEIDEDYLDDSEAKKKQGKYSYPSFYFMVETGGISARSGLLIYKDYIELEYKDEEGNPVGGAKYKLYLRNGIIKEDKLDSKGYAKVENIPPGDVDVEFDATETGG